MPAVTIFMDFPSAYTEKNIKNIINDPEMIPHEGKIRATVANAKTFSTLISKHGSIKNHIDSYSPAAGHCAMKPRRAPEPGGCAS